MMSEQFNATANETTLVRTAAAGIIAALLIAALYFGRPLLVPFALAVLLAFALSPAAEFLQRHRLPRTVSVVFTVLVAVVVIGAFGAFVGTQLGRLIEELPQYQSNLTKKIESLRGAAASNSVVESASSLFVSLKAIAEKPGATSRDPKKPIVPAVSGGARPVAVEIREPELTPFQVIQSVIDPLLEPLATLAITIIFVAFILLQKEDLRSRFISLAGSRDLQRTSRAIDDGAQRLSRYLLLQTGMNGCVGIIVALGLWAIGVPNPALWGLIAAIFRFVPYVGIPAAAAIPLALALAVDPGWTMLVLTGALYFVTEATAGQVVEPLLYGQQMGLSPMAVLLAAAFWTWVWGPVGLLLSTPLTMCVVVLGRHVEQMRFLDILLGNRPTLSAEENFYLDMIKGNPDEPSEKAEAFLKEGNLAAYYDNVALKALALAQMDINRGAVLTEETRANILLTIEGLVENLAEQVNSGATVDDNAAIAVRSTLSESELSILCVAGRGPLDQAAALLLISLLKQQGIGTRIISPDDASPNNIHRINARGVRAICISYIEPGNPANARYLVRRLRKQIPSAPIIGGFWCLPEDNTHFLDWVEATGSDLIAFNLATAVDQITNVLHRALGHEGPKAQMP